MDSETSDMKMIEELKAALSHVDTEDTMAEAGRKILLKDFIQLLKNEAGSRTGEDIEHVHDMRVATRRMRSAFRLLEDYYKSKPIRPFIEHLKRLAKHLGGVRDLDVMIQDLQTFGATLTDDEASDTLQSLIDRLDKKRRKARKKLVAFLDSNDYATFIETFAAFLTQPGSAAKPVNDGVIAPTQVRHVLPTMLHEHLATVRAYHDVIETADAPTLHALRIEFKRLRYATSFFQDVLGNSGDEFISEIKSIQDHLGRINDIDVAGRELSTMMDDEGIENDALSDYLSRLHTESETLRAGFPNVWQRFNSRAVQSKLSNALLSLK
jgi:CHAD domain-containing protein